MPVTTLAKAAMEFFSQEPHGRKISVAEFKEMTRKDREELREMLIGVGYDIVPLAPEK